MEIGQSEILLINGLCQMGMKPYMEPAGQLCGLLEQFPCDTEGRAGSQGYLVHGIFAAIMKFCHGILTVSQDLIHCLHNAVRGQAAVLFAEIHASTGGVEPHSQSVRSSELGL